MHSLLVTCAPSGDSQDNFIVYDFLSYKYDDHDLHNVASAHDC